MASLGFNTADVEPSTGDLLPPARYRFQIAESSVGGNKSGTGDICKLTFEVISTPQTGRKVFRNLNITHSNPVAQKIGQEELSAIAKAVGFEVTDSDELLWAQFEATVRHKKNSKSGEMEIALSYHAANAEAPPAAKAPPVANPSTARQTRNEATAPTRVAPGRPAAPAAQGARVLPWGAGRQPAPAENPFDDYIPF